MSLLNGRPVPLSHGCVCGGGGKSVDPTMILLPTVRGIVSRSAHWTCYVFAVASCVDSNSYVSLVTIVLTLTLNNQFNLWCILTLQKLP